jgi:uncharacterized protein YeeX (DUF496 family)
MTRAEKKAFIAYVSVFAAAHEDVEDRLEEATIRAAEFVEELRIFKKTIHKSTELTEEEVDMFKDAFED